METIKIIIVDDHNLFRMMLKSTLVMLYPDIRVVGEAESGKELFHVLTTTSADVILLDINLPDVWGAEIADRLDISINTFNNHKKHIFQKLGINNTMEMVQFALKKGIVRINN